MKTESAKTKGAPAAKPAKGGKAMKIDIGISEADRRKVVDGLSAMLSVWS